MENTLTISYHSGIYTLRAGQIVPVSPEVAWDFLSDPSNLARITPPDMNFVITNGTPEKAYAGQIITYRVSPLKGIRSNWVTELTVVKDGEFFIDEQRFGPYRMWHHEHRIKAVEGGTQLVDMISYKLPFGVLGRLVHPFLIRPTLLKIFKFREAALNQIFG